MEKKVNNQSQAGISVRKRMVADYICNVCKEIYQKKKDAIDCSELPIEEKLFKLGETVRWRELRTCSQKNKTYIAKGKITKIVLVPPDEEYILKWLNSAVDTHKWLITFKFKCPHCSKINGMQAYQEEILLV